MWHNDLAWYLFFRRRRRAIGWIAVPLFVLVILAGFAYGALMVYVAVERKY